MPGINGLGLLKSEGYLLIYLIIIARLRIAYNVNGGRFVAEPIPLLL
jgi:hypothetical protein